MADGEVADRFSRGQHAGSMGPAIALAKRLEIGEGDALLDVGGGSGAFTISLCRRNPGLNAVIFDFPSALEVAAKLSAEAGVAGRVDYHAGNALTSEWPTGHNVVLMSYLFSAVDEPGIAHLLRQAFNTLPSGGRVVIHDFMVDDDKTGPQDSALWFLTCMFNCPDGILLTPEFLKQALTEAGFTGISIDDLVPGLTRMAVARKP